MKNKFEDQNTEWMLENLLGKHSSKPYNPLIANTFFRAGLIESWGRGVELINSECEKAGVPKPEYSNKPSGLTVIFTPKAGETVEESSQKTNQKTNQKILILCTENPTITIKELAEAIGITPQGIKYSIRKLKESNKLKRVGPDKGGYWEIITNE